MYSFPTKFYTLNLYFQMLIFSPTRPPNSTLYFRSTLPYKQYKTEYVLTSVSLTVIELSGAFIDGRAGAVYAVEKPTAHDPSEIVSEANT